MASPIRKPIPPEKPEEKILRENLCAVLQNFNEELRSMMENPAEVDNSAPLTKFAAIIERLYPLASNAASIPEGGTMFSESLKDAGEILDNILTQPLFVPGGRPDMTILKAAQSFDPEQALASDLRKILVSFLQFKDPTEMMLRELEILQDELK